MKTLRTICGWIIIAICVLWTAAIGAPVIFAWDAPPPERGVTLTHLRKHLPDGTTVFLAESTGTTATIDLPPGTHIIVATDLSPAGWSPFSDPVEVTIPVPLPPAWSLDGNIITTGDGDRIKLTIQFSGDLKHWTDRPHPSARFFRIRAESR